MRLFHGSNMIIEVIDLTKSKKFKDFGQAFYLSADEEQAMKMAVAKVVQFGGEESVTSFEFDERCLNSKDLKVKFFTEYSGEWAEFIFNNRDETKNFQHSYDIVYGPIADDYIGLQIRDFKRHNITFEQFISNIRYYKGITFQYAFCTQKAIEQLVRL
ncbi:MAG: DUF3990 domain-containing protein [Prevotella sp.]|nr:DUF3990 domain-containing protein [Prevotella sp.]MBQ2950044.1 DUF3990 domain-containing protein [Prevotella sp.]